MTEKSVLVRPRARASTCPLVSHWFFRPLWGRGL